MRVDILTLFPEMFPPALGHSIIGRARKKGLLQVCCHQLRDFSPDARGRVDDTVFGGGKGMLLAAEPFARGIDQLRAHLGWQPHILYMSPRGKVLTQEDAKRLAQEPGLMLLCGHYEGVDQRLLDEYQVEEISIGDYVLTGGELPAMILTDAVARTVTQKLFIPPWPADRRGSESLNVAMATGIVCGEFRLQASAKAGK